MNTKKPKYSFRIPFVFKRKNLREETTDETKLGARKSGATLDQIIKSLRSPSRRLRNRIAPPRGRQVGEEKRKDRLFVLVGVIAFLTIIGCTQLGRNSIRSITQTIKTVAKDAGSAFGTHPSPAKRLATEKADKASGTNRDISDRVEMALLADDQLGLSDLSVETSDGVVTLRGHVRGEVQNQRAEHIARTEVGSGLTVNDRLTVD